MYFLFHNILFWIMHPTKYLVGCVIQKRTRALYTAFASVWNWRKSENAREMWSHVTLIGHRFSQFYCSQKSTFCLILMALEIFGGLRYIPLLPIYTKRWANQNSWMNAMLIQKCKFFSSSSNLPNIRFNFYIFEIFEFWFGLKRNSGSARWYSICRYQDLTISF